MTRKQDRALRRGDGFVEERTTKGGVVRYVARWRDRDRWRGKTYDTYDDAEARLQQISRDKRSGRFVPDDELSVTDAVHDYIERGRKRWKPTTVATYTAILQNHITPGIGKVRVRDLTARRCQHFIDGLSRTFAPALVEMVRSVLGGSLKEAVRLDAIPANPMAGVRMPRKVRREPEIWSGADVATIMRVSRSDPFMHAYYAIALTTGMRPGEIRALKWTDVQMDAGTIRVSRTMTRDAEYRHVVGTTTKTGTVRVVAIPQVTIDALKRYRSAQAQRRLRTEHWADTGLIFDRGNGHVIPQQTFARMHTRMVERAGVPYVAPHGLRHTAATLLLESGVDSKIVSATLGHARTATTQDIYQHIRPAVQRTVADLLGAMLDDDRAVGV